MASVPVPVKDPVLVHHGHLGRPDPLQARDEGLIAHGRRRRGHLGGLDLVLDVDAQRLFDPGPEIGEDKATERVVVPLERDLAVLR